MLTVVSYHHFAQVEDAATAGLGVTTSPERFRAHLAHYRRWYRPVSLDDVLAGNLPPRALLLTIDDAYRSVLEVAAPMLTEAGLPAVLFTNPRVVAGGYTPLDTVLALAVNTLGIAAVGRQLVSPPHDLQRLQTGLPKPVSTLASVIRETLPTLTLAGREAMRQRLLTALGADETALARNRRFLDWRDLRALHDRGIAIGNHTASHVHGRSLRDADFTTEIDAAQAALADMTGQPIAAFSFPYGNQRDATPPVLAHLRARGHRALFLVQARANRVRPAPDLWYRTPMQNDAPPALMAKLALLPELRSALRAARHLTTATPSC